MAGADHKEQQGGWSCICGQHGNQGNFCMVCGRPRPTQMQPQMPPPMQPPAGYPVMPQPAGGSGDNRVKIALGLVIILLAAVLVFFAVREGAFGGSDESNSNYSSLSRQSTSSAPDKAADTSPAKDTKPASEPNAMRSDLSLGGMDLGLTVDDMRRILGTELSSKAKAGMVFYSYPTVQVGTRGGVVTSLVSETDQAKTKRKQHQGSSLADVKAAYGTDYTESQYDGKDLYEYSFTSLDGRQGILRFAVVQGTDSVNYISIRIPD